MCQHVDQLSDGKEDSPGYKRQQIKIKCITFQKFIQNLVIKTIYIFSSAGTEFSNAEDIEKETELEGNQSLVVSSQNTKLTEDTASVQSLELEGTKEDTSALEDTEDRLMDISKATSCFELSKLSESDLKFVLHTSL